MTRTHVILPDDVVNAVGELVGQRGRSIGVLNGRRDRKTLSQPER